MKGEPIRKAISESLAAEKSLGGQERRFVALGARELSRKMRLLDLAARQLGHPPSALGLDEDRAIARYVLWRRLFTGATGERAVADVKLPGPIRPRTVKDALLVELATRPIPPAPLPEDPVERAAIRHSFPNALAQAIAASAPEGELDAVLEALDREPALILRARRPELLTALAGAGIDARAISEWPEAIEVLEAGNRVFETEPLKSGDAQVMDLGSQLICAACRPSPDRSLEGARVLDLCAGAAGKTIALADAVGPSGAVIASDLSARRLDEGKARLRPLGLSQVRFTREPKIEEAAVILIDAPCSGSGSLAREPDAKWRLTPKAIADYAQKQCALLTETFDRARAGALLVYATCSVLREEDEAVVEALLAARPSASLLSVEGLVPDVARAGPYLRVWPHRLPGGGFFAARLRKGD